MFTTAVPIISVRQQICLGIKAPSSGYIDRNIQSINTSRTLVNSALLGQGGGSGTDRSMASNENSVKENLLQLQQQLLQSIGDRDWKTYAELCDETLTAFEPEAVGHLVEGLPFHKYYFDFLSARDNYKAPANTIAQPHVRLIGDNAAVVSYIRLQQKLDGNGRPITVATEETRVWERKAGGKWRNVHFHRSPTTPSS